MGAARESTQADFDLERFIDMFDEALTSQDERVVNALRSLMMMVILTNPEGRKMDRNGPLRQLFDDVNSINRRVHQVEDTLREVQSTRYQRDGYKWDDLKEYSMQDIRSSDAFQSQLESALKQINGGYHQTNAVSKLKVPKWENYITWG